jgi:uncharacterized protein YkwD
MSSMWPNKHPRILAGLLALALICPIAWADQRGKLSVAEQYLFNAMNAERTQRGLHALHWDDDLYRAAEGHAREMAARASISHQYQGEPDLSVRAKSAGVRFSVIAENVAEAPTAVDIHAAWMRSPGHRENILNSRVDSVGIRVIRRDGQLYAVQDFARSVESLSLQQQEEAIAGLMQAEAEIPVRTSTKAARRTCEMSTGFAGEQRPGFVMRFTATELSGLPEALRTRLASGRYREAEVGACSLNGEPNFSAFNIAVLLY